VRYVVTELQGRGQPNAMPICRELDLCKCAGGLTKMQEAGFTADMLAQQDERPAAELDEWLEAPSTSGRDPDVVRPRHAAGCPAKSRACIDHNWLRALEEGKLLVVSAITIPNADPQLQCQPALSISSLTPIRVIPKPHPVQP